MLDIVFVLIYVAIAFIAALVVIFGFGGVFHVGSKKPHLIVPALLFSIPCGIGLSTAMSGRNLAYADLVAEVVTTGGGFLATNSLRAITFFVLSLAVVLIIQSYVSRAQTANRTLLWAFVAYFFGNYVTNSLFGGHPEFVHGTLYLLIVGIALLSTTPANLQLGIRYAKYGLVILVIGSLLAAAIKPTLALHQGYKGLLPGLNVRLWGLAPHANSMGPLALVLILLEISYPQSSKALGRFVLVIAGIALLLAQSKTAYVAGLTALLVVFAVRSWPQINAELKTGKMSWRSTLFVASIFVSALAIVSVLIFGNVSKALDRLLMTQEGAQLATLTGRDVVWRIALAEWDKNFLFGYGPTLWDQEFRYQIGLGFAYSAHNQLLQSLSSAGVVGAVTLLCYVSILCVGAIKSAQATRGLSLALFMIIFLRSVTETPLSTTSILTAEFLTHMLLLTTLNLTTRTIEESGKEFPRSRRAIIV